MEPQSKRIRVAAAFLVLSGLLDAAQAVGMQAIAGFPYPADLMGPLARVAVCVLLCVGLIRSVRLAWWGSLLIGAIWWLQSSMMLGAMVFLSGSLFPGDATGVFFLGTWVALSATLALLYIAGPAQRHKDPASRPRWSLPPGFGGAASKTAIVALPLAFILMWWFSKRHMHQSDQTTVGVYDTLRAILPTQEIRLSRRGSELTIETLNWIPTDSPLGNRLREARAVGRAARATYAKFPELSGITVTFNATDSAFVAPFKPGHLSPGDSSDVLTFTFNRVK